MGGYSLPLKNRDMFRDLKKGFQVYTLDTSDVPVFRMGNVVNVSEPRFQQPQMVSKELAREAADKMLNADGSKRRWTMEDAKQMFDKCGAKKPDNATWGDIQYLFAMFYSDYFPKVLDCDQKIVKAVLAYLEDPDAPEGTAFVRYLAVRCFVGDTIKWSDMI